MSLNNKILAAAIVSGLYASSAFAEVSLSDPAAAPPTRVATERNFTAGELALGNAGAFDLATRTGYAFSTGEVRYARLECSDNIEIDATTNELASASGNINFGNINGSGTNVIRFSMTAAADIAEDEVITLGVGDTGNSVVLSRDPVTCAYSLYDQPSQALAGGTTGRVANFSGTFITFVSSYVYNNDRNTSTSSVEADPSFSRFKLEAPTNSVAVAQIGQINFDLRGNFAGFGTTPVNPDTGAVVALADILGANTYHLVEGDFSAAANANGTFTGAALNRVFLSFNADCSTTDTAANVVTASSARFNLGNNAVGDYLCYAPSAGMLIPAGDYTVRLVPQNNAGWTASAAGPSAVGTIVRDGTELQAPLAQVPGGWLSRVVLTNTGSIDRPYTIAVFGETGNTISTDNLTGSVPANATLVVDLNDVLQGFTGAPRATVNVSVAGPSNQIQGLYQIVNPEAGSLSNHVMVRPGTN